MSQNGVRKKKRKTFIPAVILIIILIACSVFISRVYSQEKTTEMAEYTVTRGNIQTYKSFSATLNVENSETISNTEGVTMVKDLYVSAGQTVKKGDAILTLGTGKTFEASMSGTVNEIRFKKGDYVWPNISLVQICDMEHLEVQIQVDEYDIKKVEVGQKCIVTVIPLSMEFETVINHVNRMSASSRGVAYYPVKARLDVPDEVMPGMTVSVRFLDETAEDVLVLPMAALSFNKDDEPCIQRKTANGYEMIPVTLGLSDGMQVEIKDGLSEGDKVYAPKIGTDEDEGGVITKQLRKIFGTKTVIQPENTRDSRGGSRGMMFPDGMSSGGPGGGMPEWSGNGTPGERPQMPEGGWGESGMERPSFPDASSEEKKSDQSTEEGKSEEVKTSGTESERTSASGENEKPGGQSDVKSEQTGENADGSSETGSRQRPSRPDWPEGTESGQWPARPDSQEGTEGRQRPSRPEGTESRQRPSRSDSQEGTERRQRPSGSDTQEGTGTQRQQAVPDAQGTVGEEKAQ